MLVQKSFSILADTRSHESSSAVLLYLDRVHNIMVFDNFRELGKYLPSIRIRFYSGTGNTGDTKKIKYDLFFSLEINSSEDKNVKNVFRPIF